MVGEYHELSMPVAEVATTTVAPADLEEEEAGVTVEAAVTLEAEEAVVEDLAAAPEEEAMEAVMEDHLVDMEDMFLGRLYHQRSLGPTHRHVIDLFRCDH